MKINYTIKSRIRKGDQVIFNKELYDSLAEQGWLGNCDGTNFAELDNINHNDVLIVKYVKYFCDDIEDPMDYIEFRGKDWSYPLKVVTKKT